MNIFPTLLLLAGLFYGASFVVRLLYLSKRAERGNGSPALKLAVCGFALQGLALAIHSINGQRLPLGNAFEVLETVVWLFIAIELSFRIVFKIRFAGIFSMPLACILTMLPAFCPAFYSNTAEFAKAGSALGVMHAAFAAFALALILCAAIFSAMLLAQISSLSNKSHSIMMGKMPSVAALESLVRLSLVSSTATMGVSVVLGAVATIHITLTNAVIIKFCSAILLFAFQLILSRSVYVRDVRGKALARRGMALGIFALFAMIPILAGTF